MRLYKHLNETIYSLEQLEIIDGLEGLISYDVDFKMLKKFVKECGNQPIYRGTQDYEIGLWKVKNGHIKDRIPKDTKAMTHAAWNDMFKSKFGWNVRNGIFTTGLESESYEYGVMYYFYPLGKYKYCWSTEIGDLHNNRIAKSVSNPVESKYWYDYLGKNRDKPTYFPGEFKQYLTFLNFDSEEKFMDSCEWIMKNKILKTYRDDNLSMAIDKGHEISFNCDKYLLTTTNITYWLMNEIN